jgi:uncharacterized protein
VGRPTVNGNWQQAKKTVARIKSLEQNDADAPAIFGLPAAYWLDLKGYDPAAEAKKLSIPILILYGERDFQVPKVDFDLWKSGLAGRTNVTARSYPALNHAFVAGSGPSSEKEYQVPGHVAPKWWTTSRSSWARSRPAIGGAGLVG